MDLWHSPPWAGWVLLAPYHSIVPCLSEKSASVFRDEKMRGFTLVPVTCFDIQRCPWPPSVGGWAILSGPFAAAVAASAAEPEEALWRWSHSSAQPTCWNFPEILHCRHFPRRYANGIRKNQLSLRNRGMRRAVNATGWVIGWLLAGDRSASHPYIILMNFYGMPPLLLAPSPPPYPPSAGEEGLWLAASQLIECSWHCCSRGQIGTFALQAEKSGFGEIAPPCPSATKALLNMQIFFMKLLYSPSCLSVIFLSEERAKKKKRLRKRKK